MVSQQEVADVLKMHGDMVAETMSQTIGSMSSTSALALGTASGTAMSSSTSPNFQKVTEAQKSLSEVDQLADENKMDEAIAMLKVGTQQAFDAQKILEQQSETTDTAAAEDPALASTSSTEPVQSTTTAEGSAVSTGEKSTSTAPVSSGEGG